MTVSAPRRTMRWEPVRRWSLRLVGAAMLCAAAWVLWREFRSLNFEQIRQQAAVWGFLRVAAALALGAASFCLVGVVEWLGLRWSGVAMPISSAMARSFVVNGLIHSVGANVVTATIARSWVYRRRRLTVISSASVTAFAAVSFFGGLAALASGGLLLATPAQLEAIRLAPGTGRRVAIVLLVAAIAYVVLCGAFRRRKLFGRIRAPPAAYALAQILLGAIDNAVSAALLWLLLGPGATAYPPFLVAYVLACLAAQLSLVPGGVGVFDGAIVLLSPQVRPAALAAGLLGFRLLFYVAPLALALGAAAWDALRANAAETED